MVEVKIDILKNIIFIKAEDFLSDLEIKEALELIFEEVIKLKKDFTVITDVTKFKPVSHEAAIEIQRMQEYLINNGAKKFVRIVENILGKIQFTKFAKENDFDIIEVSTIEEAYKHV